MNRLFQRPPNDSFDYKLFFAFFIGMLPQMLLPINGIFRVTLALIWLGFLISLGIRYRQKHQWQWPGIKPIDLLKTIAVVGFGLWTLLPFLATAAHSSADFSRAAQNGGETSRQLWQPENIKEALDRLIELMPTLMQDKTPVVNFLVIPCVYFIFCIFNVLRVTYLSQETFLKDCRQVETLTPLISEGIQRRSNHQQSLSGTETKPWHKRIISFFQDRSFIVKKDNNAIRLEFFKISSQDLQENFALILMPLVFFVFSLYGLFGVFAFGIHSYLSQMNQPGEASILLFTAGFQILFFGGISYMLWSGIISVLFTQRIIEFRSNELVSIEKTLGHQKILFSVAQKDLTPLQTKERESKISEVVNAALLIQYRGKDVELAGHLLPEAMDAVQEIYDRYLTSSYSTFYAETRSLIVK